MLHQCFTTLWCPKSCIIESRRPQLAIHGHPIFWGLGQGLCPHNAGIRWLSGKITPTHGQALTKASGGAESTLGGLLTCSSKACLVMSRAWCLTMLTMRLTITMMTIFIIHWKVWGVRPKWGEKKPFKNMTKHGKLGEIMENSEKIWRHDKGHKTWQSENLTLYENCSSNFSVSALGWYPARVCNVKGPGSYKACGQIHHMWFSKECM